MFVCFRRKMPINNKLIIFCDIPGMLKIAIYCTSLRCLLGVTLSWHCFTCTKVLVKKFENVHFFSDICAQAQDFENGKF